MESRRRDQRSRTAALIVALDNLLHWYVPTSKAGSELLFDVITTAYERIIDIHIDIAVTLQISKIHTLEPPCVQFVLDSTLRKYCLPRLAEYCLFHGFIAAQFQDDTEITQ